MAVHIVKVHRQVVRVDQALAFDALHGRLLVQLMDVVSVHPVVFLVHAQSDALLLLESLDDVIGI